ncbi:MAG: PD-(D/E)XK nuclease family protein [Proteobacteria bacterium]|nr:PD-(D/E)XK nuclease family protein [Pseudomonadota bacterium]
MIRIGFKRILSPTAINTYLDCPHKFYLRYIKRLKTKPSIYLIRGNVVHRVLARFNQHSPQTGHSLALVQMQRTLLRDLAQEWQRSLPSLQALGLSEEQLRQFELESQLMLINFAAWKQRNPTLLVTRYEARLVSKKLGLLGIVDAIHDIGGEPIVVDYKTSRRPEITPEIERQAAIYALLYGEFFGRPLEEVWIHFLASEGDPEAIRVDDALLHYARTLVESTHQNTISEQEEDYPCTCGGRCERDFINT